MKKEAEAARDKVVEMYKIKVKLTDKQKEQLRATYNKRF